MTYDKTIQSGPAHRNDGTNDTPDMEHGEHQGHVQRGDVHFETAAWTTTDLAVLAASSCAMLIRSYAGTADVEFFVVPSRSREGKAIPFEIRVELSETAEEFMNRARHLLSECGVRAAVGDGAGAAAPAIPPSSGRPFHLCLDLRVETATDDGLRAGGQMTDNTLTVLFCATPSGISYQVCYRDDQDGVLHTGVWVRRYLGLLVHLTRQLGEVSKDCRVVDVIRAPSPQDLLEIWTMNQSVAKPPQTTLHELFSTQAHLRPTATAIDAWDGVLSYARLDRLSTHLADLILASGAQHGSSIALYLRRSVWLIVGMLAAMKAGCAFVPFDPDWPIARRNRVMQLTQSRIVLTCKDFVYTPAETEEAPPGITILRLPDCLELVQFEVRSVTLPSVDSSAAAYVLFTSGSTGEPKGVVIEHRSIIISLQANGAQLGAGEHTRILQFATPTFDISVAEIWGTLILGGAVLVPSEADRKTNLPEYIVAKQVNHAALTPTVARLFTPDDVSCLRTLVLGGEAVLPADVKRWRSVPNLFNGFGPTECSVCCALHRIGENETAPAIGRLRGVPLWVVDPEDHERIMPMGAVGELVVEGWSVGRGYWGDNLSTQAAFLADPVWLTAGCKDNFPGRRGRIYKTGDLVRYDPFGNLLYVGRKADDLQVKIRGQRLGLGDVESHLRDCLPTGAEAIVVDVADMSSTILVAVLCFHSKYYGKVPDGPVLTVMSPAEAAAIQAQLAEQVPAYAVPTIFLRIAAIPSTTSDKADRRRIRALAKDSLPTLRDQVISRSTGIRLPTTPESRSLAAIWARILQIPMDRIGLDDNFLKLGGDSVKAVALVRDARLRLGLQLTMEQVFQSATLEDLAAASTIASNAEEGAPIEPFSLLPAQDIDVPELRHDLAISCGLQEHTSVRDAYPCTPLQEVLLSLSAQYVGAYTIQRVLRLQNEVNLTRFIEAWEEVVRHTAILTTRITQHPKYGLMNVVSGEPIHWTHLSSADLESFLQRDRETALSTDQPLMRCAVVHADPDTPRYFVCTMHHALYDAWSMPLLWERLLQAFRGEQLIPSTFAPFVKWCKYGRDEPSRRSYWEEVMHDSDSTTLFPPVPTSISKVREDSCSEYQWSMLERSASGITRANRLAAAWALVAGHYSGSQDVLFGVTTSGRSAPVVGISQIMGPTIATAPQRVRFRLDQPVSEFLQAVQDAAIGRIPFEQTGIEQISGYSSETRKIRAIQTFLVVQPEEYGGHEMGEVGEWVTGAGNFRYDVSALTLEVFLKPQGEIRCVAYYDSRVIENRIVKRCVSQLAHVTWQLDAASPDATVGSIEILTMTDIKEILALQDEPLRPVTEALPHRDIAMQEHTRPMAPAVQAHDRVLNYTQLWTESGRLAQRLIVLGVGPGHQIPLFLPPSSSVVVSMIAVLRTGASFAPISPDLPDARVQQLLLKLEYPVYVTSPSMNSRDVSFGKTAQIILQPDSEVEITDVAIPEAVEPDSAAWVIFTSGSTGTPKGVVISHSAAHTSFRKLGETFELGRHSRMLQFSSLAFDACVLEIIGTLMHGGCICIPAPDSQQSTTDLPLALQKMHVNTAILTPSIARQVEPKEVSCLDTLILTGEALVQNDLDRWQDVPRLFNAYGPAECSNMCAVRRIRPGDSDPECIGSLSGVENWVVNPEMPGQLSPVGGVGELVVGGATVGSGYLRDPEKTAAAFIQDLPWLARGPQRGTIGKPMRMYRTGDLVRVKPDGTLSYCGRKDSQVKIRGQRVELGDIEHHAMRLDGTPEAVAEVVEVGEQAQQLLVVFLRENGDVDIPVLCASHALIPQLENTLPRHMVPSYVICIPVMPCSLSGKTNRSQLRKTARELIETQWRDTMQASVAEQRSATTWEERVLAQAWKEALGARVASRQIGLDDDFVQLGGSSIDALKVVSACRRLGFSLTVATVLRFRCLEAQARQGTRVVKGHSDVNGMHQESYAPFSLLTTKTTIDTQQLRADVASECGIPVETVQDAYPCVPLQIGLLSLSMQGVADRAYLLQHTFDVPREFDMARIKRAWAEVVRTTDVLRTRIVHHQTAGFLQVVVHEEMCWQEHNDERSPTRMGLGERLSTFDMIRSTSSHPDRAVKEDCRKLVWTVHHAVADGWTLELILDKVRRLYDGVSSAPAPSDTFRPFVRWFHKHWSDDQAVQYWRENLAGIQTSTFPPLQAAAVDGIVADTSIEHCCSIPVAEDATFASIARAAWALVQSRHAMSRDVVFAEVRSGRTVDLPQAETIIGPMLTTLPFRARVEAGTTVGGFLEDIQKTALSSIAHEHLGLRRIAGIDNDCAAACAAVKTLIAIQPSPRPKSDSPVEQLFREAPRYRLVDYALCIEITPGEQADDGQMGVRLHAGFDPRIVGEAYVCRLLRHLASALVQLASLPRNAALARASTLPSEEIEQIWAWSTSSSSTPGASELLLHERILQNAQSRPHALAVQAWDGDLTYSQLAGLSLALARRLRRCHGVGRTCQFVPWYVEKSRWSVVAFLAVLCTGAAIVPLEPAHPFARTEQCLSSLPDASAAGRIAIVSASLAYRWASRLDTQLIELCDDLFHHLEGEDAGGDDDDTAAAMLSNVAPAAPCWVLFTSGTSGRPKGVVLEHRAPAASFPQIAHMLGLGQHTRMLQFTSHAFDVFTWEISTSLLVGGTLLVPSEEQRMHSLPAFCAQFHPNAACLTPGLIRAYSPQALSTLQVLLVGGAAPSKQDFRAWSHVPSLWNAYGPTEASVISALACASKAHPELISGCLGRIPGTSLWVCDPEDSCVLAPIGTVGELVIESPTLARGYLDADQTAASFKEDPEWLVEGVRGLRPGKHAKVYRTGDLVRLDEQGQLHYLGRRDKQVKIRGQRVELADVEHNIVECLDDVASTVVVMQRDGLQKMVAFVRMGHPLSSGEVSPHLTAHALSPAAEIRLKDRLPAYMLPKTWISIGEIPLTTSGKTDEDTLQRWIKAFHDHELDRRRTAIKRMPTTSLEKALHRSWAQALNLEGDAIDMESNFFAIGGDSISALELVAGLRRTGIELAVTDIYRKPALGDLSKWLECSAAPSPPIRSEADKILPFSLLPSEVEVEQLRGEVAGLCGTSPESVEDVFPCTALQTGMLAVSAQSTGAYVLRYVLEFGPGHDLTRFRTAWQDLLGMMPILRTRILNHWSAGFLQVVLRSEHAEEKGPAERQELASCTGSLVEAREDSPARFILQIHHALYDAVTLQLLVDTLSSLYQGAHTHGLADYRLFIKHLASNGSTASEQFWRSTLDDFHAPVFPSLPSSVSEVIENRTTVIQCTFPVVPAHVTRASILRAAWALAVSWYTGHEDVVFGDVRSGRDADLVGIERMPGPTIATVPLSIRATGSLSVPEYLQQVQHRISSISPHEQLGLHKIQGLSSACANACRFQTLFNIHIGQAWTPADNANGTNELHAWTADSDFKLRSFALVVEATIERQKPDYTVTASFDSRVISDCTLERVLHQFSSLVTRLATSASDDTQRLSQLGTISDADRQLINIADYGHLGRGKWLVLPHDQTRLAPAGAVGELVLEHKDDLHQDRPSFEVAVASDVQWLDKRPTTTLWSNGEYVRYEHGHGLIHVGWKDRADSEDVNVSSDAPGKDESNETSKLQTETEIVVASLWAEVLGQDFHQITRADSFSLLGGNSVSCVSLISKCRARGFLVSVPDLLRHPRLQDFAAIAAISRSSVRDETDAPFSLLFHGETQSKQLEAFLTAKVMPGVGCDRQEIEDVLPCTYMQVEFLQMDGGLQHHLRLDFGLRDIHAAALEQAVFGLVTRHSILRTVFCLDDDHGYIQVVLRSVRSQIYTNIHFGECEALDSAAARLIEMARTSLHTSSEQKLRFVLLSRDSEAAKEHSLLILNLSHAQFDGFSLPVIVRDLAALYQVAEDELAARSQVNTTALRMPASQFSEVIYGRSHTSTSKVRMHWARLLAGASAVPPFTENYLQASYQNFECELLDGTQPRSCSKVEKTVSLATWNRISEPAQKSYADVGTGIVVSAEDVLTAAWAVATAFVGRSDDVLFGLVVNGRRALPGNVANGESIVGPLMNIIPVRVKVPLYNDPVEPANRLQTGRHALLRDLVSALATQNAQSAAHEQTDLDEIATEFAPSGVWPELPKPSAGARRRFRWGSIVAWQDYRRLQAVDEPSRATDAGEDSADIARGYLSPFASLSQISFAGRPCSVTSHVPSPDLANVTLVGRVEDNDQGDVRLSLEHLPGAITSETARLLVDAVVATIEIMATEPDVLLHELVARLG
ncbi:unnamed protein product [Zymoseptoria tritici ST99CH_1A5]|uniref:Carrier domain-containing protein n=1 Tax=Zymoseptoria tritici ST99CH_1A5 TaxID=1276529 RepID=A0A1Y6LNS3_ZYMTR|nr:unnamed protein product [Zymoseptoria tritici ST99CH_1A5]